MPRIKLDKIDRKILKDLQENGRITNVELAQNAGISAPPCLRRVRALEDAGYIQSYHAKLDPSLMGFSVTVYAFVKLESHADKDLKAFEDVIKDLDIVRECSMIAGDTDYMLKIVAKDWDSYQDFHSSVLTNAPGVHSIRTSLSIKTFKDEYGIPVDENA